MKGIQILKIDHVALHVSEVARSVAFYKEVLGLEPLDRPDFDFDGAWFGLGSGYQLHLLEGLYYKVESDSRKSHFALKVADIHACAEHLAHMGVPFRGPKARPDGVLQVFLYDPDGHCIELN